MIPESELLHPATMVYALLDAHRIYGNAIVDISQVHLDEVSFTGSLAVAVMSTQLFRDQRPSLNCFPNYLPIANLDMVIRPHGNHVYHAPHYDTPHPSPREDYVLLDILTGLTHQYHETVDIPEIWTSRVNPARWLAAYPQIDPQVEVLLPTALNIRTNLDLVDRQPISWLPLLHMTHEPREARLKRGAPSWPCRVETSLVWPNEGKNDLVAGTARIPSLSSLESQTPADSVVLALYFAKYAAALPSLNNLDFDSVIALKDRIKHSFSSDDPGLANYNDRLRDQIPSLVRLEVNQPKAITQFCELLSILKLPHDTKTIKKTAKDIRPRIREKQAKLTRDHNDFYYSCSSPTAHMDNLYPTDRVVTPTH